MCGSECSFPKRTEFSKIDVHIDIYYSEHRDETIYFTVDEGKPHKMLSLLHRIPSGSARNFSKEITCVTGIHQTRHLLLNLVLK